MGVTFFKQCNCNIEPKNIKADSFSSCFSTCKHWPTSAATTATPTAARKSPPTAWPWPTRASSASPRRTISSPLVLNTARSKKMTSEEEPVLASHFDIEVTECKFRSPIESINLQYIYYNLKMFYDTLSWSKVVKIVLRSFSKTIIPATLATANQCYSPIGGSFISK